MTGTAKEKSKKSTTAGKPALSVRAKAKSKAKAKPKSNEKRASTKASGKTAAAKQRKIGVPSGQGKTAKTGEADPFEIAKQTVKGSVPAIVKAMVELAKQGSCTHAKTLLEMTGAKHMFDSEGETQESGEPWAKMVLERLGEAEPVAEQENANGQEKSQELVGAQS